MNLYKMLLGKVFDVFPMEKKIQVLKNSLERMFYSVFCFLLVEIILFSFRKWSVVKIRLGNKSGMSYLIFILIKA